jgi:protein-S-isoprenylcysteine O-methyltransferase Ste14
VVDLICESIGYCLMFSGLALRIWSTMYIGQRKSKELITDGPFSICRNPLYVGTLAITIGASLIIVNYVLLMTTLLVTVPLHYLVVLSEEKNLETVFGKEYTEYKRNVPRFWFHPSKFKTPEYIQVSPRSIYRVAGESALVLMIPVIENTVGFLHQKNILPTWGNF